MTQVNVFHVLAITQYRIHTESSHTLSVYVARVLQCLLITKLPAEHYVQTPNIVQCFMRFTVELRVKDLEGSVHQTMHKQVLKIRSLSSRTASALGLIVALRKVLPNL
jgi:hypothetical protein